MTLRAFARLGWAFAAFAVLIGPLSGCSVHRDLRLTEVGKRAVELYLDEPADNRLTLVDHRLIVHTSDGGSAEIDLGALGRSLAGGEFLIVWEESGYNGTPVAEDYQGGVSGAVPGIKVANNFFLDMGDAAAAEVRLAGRHERGWITDRVDDCIRFGDPAQRPRTGGSLDENASPPLNPPGGSATLKRWWGASTGAPVDNDQETDWTLNFGHTWGAPTN